jgi:hypothetical protein
MSHALKGGQAPDQANSRRQTGAAVPPGRIIPKARNAASHPTSHKQHGDTRLATAPDRPTRRVSQPPEGRHVQESSMARSSSPARSARRKSAANPGPTRSSGS